MFGVSDNVVYVVGRSYQYQIIFEKYKYLYFDMKEGEKRKLKTISGRQGSGNLLALFGTNRELYS